MIIVLQVLNMKTGEIKEFRWVNKKFNGEYFYQSDEEVEAEISEYINHMIMYNTLDDGDDEFWTNNIEDYLSDWHREWQCASGCL